MNTKEDVTMVYIPGKIRAPLLQEVYDNGRQGLITLGDWQRGRIQCEHCVAPLSAASLPTHIENQYGVFPLKVLNQTLLVDQPPVTYRETLSLPVDRFYWPIPGCPSFLETEANLC